ncbi:MAG: lytic polysaccharide monooxygenase auxiliary activity family 9 protein [Planctomycetota bacterium]
MPKPVSTKNHRHTRIATLGLLLALAATAPLSAHGTVVYPMSRVYRVYLANPDNPAFPLAAAAVTTDGTLSYYTWNELSRNIPQAVTAGLPTAFDYSPWVPDGQLASGGRTDPNSPDYPRTYAGLDQVSPNWPTTTVSAGSTIQVDFLATAPHDPSVWDVWMTTPSWSPTSPLTWAHMAYLGRPTVTLNAGHYYFDVTIPSNRSGHHVIWVAWHRDDPVGEVFFSTSDVMVMPTGTATFVRGDSNEDGSWDISDPIQTLQMLFGMGSTNCDAALDANDDDAVNLADAVYQLAALFNSGAWFPAPINCGSDPTPGTLDCIAFSSCP